MKFPFESNGPQPVKLIFNPRSGSAAVGPDRLQVIVAALQSAGLLPEVYLVEPEHDIRAAVKGALRRGHRLFVVCGGDGTIDVAAGALAGTRATLGIVPMGTRNNVAYSLGLPDHPLEAAQLLRTGPRRKIDVGLAECGGEQRVFLEACSVGLLSALFPASDDLQHGNLTRLPDVVSTLISTPPAEIRLQLYGQPPLDLGGYVLVAANMPFVGPRYPLAPNSSLEDGLLELVVFADLSKLDLLGTALQVVTGGAEDRRIRRYQVRQAVIETRPPMPVVVDGFPFEAAGPLRLSVRRRALNVIAGPELRGGGLPAQTAPPGQ